MLIEVENNLVSEFVCFGTIFSVIFMYFVYRIVYRLVDHNLTSKRINQYNKIFKENEHLIVNSFSRISSFFENTESDIMTLCYNIQNNLYRFLDNTLLKYVFECVTKMISSVYNIWNNSRTLNTCYEYNNNIKNISMMPTKMFTQNFVDYTLPTNCSEYNNPMNKCMEQIINSNHFCKCFISNKNMTNSPINKFPNHKFMAHPTTVHPNNKSYNNVRISKFFKGKNEEPKNQYQFVMVNKCDNEEQKKQCSFIVDTKGDNCCLNGEQKKQCPFVVATKYNNDCLNGEQKKQCPFVVATRYDNGCLNGEQKKQCPFVVATKCNNVEQKNQYPFVVATKCDNGEQKNQYPFVMTTKCNNVEQKNQYPSIMHCPAMYNFGESSCVPKGTHSESPMGSSAICGDIVPEPCTGARSSCVPKGTHSERVFDIHENYEEMRSIPVAPITKCENVCSNGEQQNQYQQALNKFENFIGMQNNPTTNKEQKNQCSNDKIDSSNILKNILNSLETVYNNLSKNDCNKEYNVNLSSIDDIKSILEGYLPKQSNNLIDILKSFKVNTSDNNTKNTTDSKTNNSERNESKTNDSKSVYIDGISPETDGIRVYPHNNNNTFDNIDFPYEALVQCRLSYLNMAIKYADKNNSSKINYDEITLEDAKILLSQLIKELDINDIKCMNYNGDKCTLMDLLYYVMDNGECVKPNQKLSDIYKLIYFIIVGEDKFLETYNNDMYDIYTSGKNSSSDSSDSSNSLNSSESSSSDDSDEMKTKNNITDDSFDLSKEIITTDECENCSN